MIWPLLLVVLRGCTMHHFRTEVTVCAQPVVTWQDSVCNWRRNNSKPSFSFHPLFIFKSVWWNFLRASALWITELSASSWQAGSAYTLCLSATGLFCSGGWRGVGGPNGFAFGIRSVDVFCRTGNQHQAFSFLINAAQWCKTMNHEYAVILTFHMAFRACIWRASPATMLTWMGINIFNHAALLDFPNVVGYSYSETGGHDLAVRSVRMRAHGNVSCAPRCVQLVSETDQLQT